MKPSPDYRVRAEALWEELGGDLCLCQRIDVPHWCESCQWKIALIMDAFVRVREVGHGELRWTLDNIYTIARRENRRVLDSKSLRVEMWDHVQRLCEKCGAKKRTVGVLREGRIVE